MGDKFSQSDERNLLSQPGFFYFRDYGSSSAFQKAVFMNGSSYQVNSETAEIAFDDVGTVSEEISTETVDINISAGQVLDLNLITSLSGGLYSLETVAGTLVEGHEQVVNSGKWDFDKTILLDHQNHDLSEISITSVTGSVDGALSDGTDFVEVKLEGVGRAIVIFDTVNLTTDNQNLTIVFNYTPSSKKIMKRGGVKVIQPIEIAFQTVATSVDSGEDEFVTYYFYKAFPSGNIGHGFSPENSAEPITMDLTFSAKSDTNRDSGDRLYSVVRGDDFLG